ncbi:RhoGAP domain-containing protein [Blyttiomyces helicus]|uniref:RhoGAP domain-containing protein n=1 Tax=Blyttiomyces helicus TaxID=388810 RepID=A0A4V1IPU3_9FUNG|nr:RhoGAP domain-containing protein [Blyttiomyces helicus]|eukprot:RKO84257.1 RhoGAP domain-containing protein [Blyttiomyces helicus]
MRKEEKPDAIPALLDKCLKAVESRGLDKEGIYRVSGKVTDVTDLKARLEENLDNIDLESDHWDIHVVAALIKMYLRQLPVPVIEFSPQERAEFARHIEPSRTAELRKRIKALPKGHKPVLKRLADHLALVAAHSGQNKMTLQNLALIFTPFMFQAQQDLVEAAPTGALATTAANFFRSSTTTEKVDLTQFEYFKSDGILEELIVKREAVFSNELPGPPMGRHSPYESMPVSSSPPPGTPPAAAARGLLFVAGSGSIPTRMDSLPAAQDATLTAPPRRSLSRSPLAGSSVSSLASLEDHNTLAQIPTPTPAPSAIPQSTATTIPVAAQSISIALSLPEIPTSPITSPILKAVSAATAGPPSDDYVPAPAPAPADQTPTLNVDTPPAESREAAPSLPPASLPVPVPDVAVSDLEPPFVSKRKESLPRSPARADHDLAPQPIVPAVQPAEQPASEPPRE